MSIKTIRTTSGDCNWLNRILVVLGAGAIPNESGRGLEAKGWFNVSYRDGSSEKIFQNHLFEHNTSTWCRDAAHARRMWLNRALGAIIQRFAPDGVHEGELECFNITIASARPTLLDWLE